MAKVPAKAILKHMIMSGGGGGLPSKGQMLAAGPDNVPAVIHSSDGKKALGPAAIKSGEFVMSILSIIGMGKGNYDNGLKKIKMIHDHYKAQGEQYLAAEKGQGLGSVQ